MKTKKCTKCYEEKSYSEFYRNKNFKDGHVQYCKRCTKDNRKKSYEENKESIKKKAREYYYENKEARNEYARKYVKENREQFLLYSKKYFQQNKEKIKLSLKKYREENREQILLQGREYYRRNREDILKGKKIKYKENREEINERAKAYARANRWYTRQYEKDRWDNDPLFRLRKSIATLIRKNLIKNKETGSTLDILGCSMEELRNHLERQFKKGMTWDNIGEWHIDHIVPKSLGRTEEEVVKLNHYTNLQPLWAKDNLVKRAKITKKGKQLLKEWRCEYMLDR